MRDNFDRFSDREMARASFEASYPIIFKRPDRLFGVQGLMAWVRALPEMEAWLNERGGGGWGRFGQRFGFSDPDLAFEFKMRWL